MRTAAKNGDGMGLSAQTTMFYAPDFACTQQFALIVLIGNHSGEAHHHSSRQF